MAPKKPKKPTMLQRQRALRKMQQERKARSSKQLPSKGNTSANSRQARSQRTTTAKAQAANQQRVIARGMEGFVRRGKAMDKLDKAAKGTKGSGTRTAGAGGGIAKRPSSAVQRRQTTASTPKGGAVATQGRGPLGGQRSLPRGRRGGSLEKAGPTIDVTAKPPRSAAPIRNPNGTTGKQARQLAEGLPNRGRTPSRGGGAARTATSAVRKAATKGAAGLANRALSVLGVVEAAKDVKRVADQNKRWDAYKERMGMNQKPNSTNRRGQGSGNKPRSNDMKPAAKTQQQGPQQTPQMVADYKAKRDARHKALRDKMPTAKPRPSGSGTSPARTPRPAGKVPASSQTPPKPRFKGSVDEGRRIWAEKYSSSKYDGQAIQKEAKALLDKLKKRKEDKSAAQRAGWDGNKNY